MEASKLDPEYLHGLSMFYPQIVEHFHDQQPTVYQDGGAYCCLSGSNPAEGIFGCGPAPEDAVADWEKSYLKARENGSI